MVEAVEIDDIEVQDSETSIEAPELHRSLKTRHITMISLGGTIGTGLFFASGIAVATAGPAGALLSYFVVGTMVFWFMGSLGEMATYMPVSGFHSYAEMFFDDALGFALGWNYWFFWSVALATELVAAGLIMSYWIPTEQCPAWVWALVFLFILLVINMISVKGFGEAEFWFALIKILAVLCFVIIAILVVTGLGGKKIGAKVFLMDPFHGGMIGLFNIFLTAGFTFQGTELVGVAAGESENPKKSVPQAIRQVFWRILFFYISSILMIGFVLPYNDSSLVLVSPFTLVFEKARIPYAPDIMNAVIIIAILSAGNSGLYAASRTLCALSVQRQAPLFLSSLSLTGVPRRCIAATALVSCVVYIISLPAVGSGGIYQWLVNLTSTSGYIAWLSIAFSHIRFRMAFQAQDLSVSENLSYTAFLYPFGPIYTIVIGLFILVGQGYQSFYPEFVLQKFLGSYITIPVFILLYFGYKIVYKTEIIALHKVALTNNDYYRGDESSLI